MKYSKLKRKDQITLLRQVIYNYIIMADIDDEALEVVEEKSNTIVS